MQLGQTVGMVLLPERDIAKPLRHDEGCLTKTGLGKTLQCIYVWTVPTIAEASWLKLSRIELFAEIAGISL